MTGVLFEEPDGGVGPDAVGLLGVGPLGGEPTEGGAEARAGRDADDLVLVVLVPPARVDHLEPGRRIVESAGADLVGHAVVIKLADAGHEIAVLLEELVAK